MVMIYEDIYPYKGIYNGRDTSKYDYLYLYFLQGQAFWLNMKI